ncbi:MAG: response regulator transcription factor [Pseudobacter sp.]|uniref:response regulator transcription factor n=1 Tax=Pseudobacter sp. TaxID=2045420 RepID=UPI003F821738
MKNTLMYLCYKRMGVIRVIIADDHGIVRLGTAMLVREIYPLAEICEATTFISALQQLEKKQFSLIILDINMPGGDNVQMIENIRVRYQDLPILILSSYDESIYAARYFKAGVNGYLQKETDPREIKKAIQKVIHGEMYASEAVHRQLLRSLASSRWNKKQDRFPELSDRELEIMRLLASGLSSTEIKQQLNIQLSTISTHKARIFEKMQVTNVVQLAEKFKEMEKGRGLNPADDGE